MNIIRELKKYGCITLGTLLFGAGISLLIDPNNFAPGGVSGLSILLSRLLPLDTGTLFLLMNVPVMIFGGWKFGRRFLLITFYAIFMCSLFTNLFENCGALTKEPLLAALFGGAVVALGMGLVLKNGGTTGGTDVIIRYLRRKKPHLKTGTLLLMMDAVVVGLSGLVFEDVDTMLYSILSIIVTSRVLDLVLYGKDEARMIYIISDAYERMTERILEELNVGVTHLSGKGGYAGKEKEIILCVVKKQNAHKVEEIVKCEDERAFMIVTSASEIYGEGYKSYFGEKL